MGYKKLLILLAASTLVITGCKKKNSSSNNPDGGSTYTMYTFTGVSPSNWNELTYQDANDTQILSYIGSNFFEFNFEFDAEGEIVDGGYATEYSAAKSLKDVTANFANQYGVPANATNSYAYEIELRDDLKWDDGSEIHGSDFVYSMKQLLDPAFQNYRAGSMYEANIVLHGAKDYLYQGQHVYTTPVTGDDYTYIDNSAVKEYDEGYGYKDEDGNWYDIGLRLDDSPYWTGEDKVGFLYYYDYYIANGVYYWGHRGQFTTGQAVDENGFQMFYVIGDDTETVVILYKPAAAEGEEDEAYFLDGDERVVLTVEDSQEGQSYVFKNAEKNIEYDRMDLAPVMVNYPQAEKIYNAFKASGEDLLVLTADLKQALSDATAFLHGYEDEADYYAGAGEYAYQEWQEWCYFGEDIPEFAWENVGILADGNKVTIVLDKQVKLLNDDNSLNYRAAYILGSLPLVKESLYEANKQAPQAGATLYTSTYNSSAESTASWGPYRLASFQTDKEYVLERNPYWFGYNMDQYKGQYQTDRIVCETIPKWETAWLKFQQGDLTSIGIDPSIADEYKASERAIFTPGDSVWSFQIQSNEEALKGRESDGVDKEIIANQKFRKALSLGFNRAEYASTCFTADLPSLSLFTELHYYDVEVGGKYLACDAYKEMICRFYNVNPSDYPSLDDAVESITGYDLDQARRLLTEAYNEQKEAGKISDTDDVVISIGVSTYSTTYKRIVEYLTKSWTKLAETTPLEGRIKLEVKEYGSSWSKEFKNNGAYDLIPAAGWSGSAWDMPNLLDAYLNPKYMYSKAWDTSAVPLTLTINGEELTMSIIEWNNCLLAQPDAPYNFGEGFLDTDERLKIMAAIEEVLLETAYSVPTVSDYSATLLSFKVDYITRKYNTFMGYGGIRYMTYNYDDAAWDAVKAEMKDKYKH